MIHPCDRRTDGRATAIAYRALSIYCRALKTSENVKEDRKSFFAYAREVKAKAKSVADHYVIVTVTDSKIKVENINDE